MSSSKDSVGSVQTPGPQPSGSNMTAYSGNALANSTAPSMAVVTYNGGQLAAQMPLSSSTHRPWEAVCRPSAPAAPSGTYVPSPAGHGQAIPHSGPPGMDVQPYGNPTAAMIPRAPPAPVIVVPDHVRNLRSPMLNYLTAGPTALPTLEQALDPNVFPFTETCKTAKPSIFGVVKLKNVSCLPAHCSPPPFSSFLWMISNGGV